MGKLKEAMAKRGFQTPAQFRESEQGKALHEVANQLRALKEPKAPTEPKAPAEPKKP